MTKPSPYEEGRIAAAEGIHCTACPYRFEVSKVSEFDFNTKIRPLYDQWWKGWSDWLRENNLDYKFKPIKRRTKA